MGNEQEEHLDIPVAEAVETITSSVSPRVVVSLLVYALRTYPKRLKELAANAAKHSRKHGVAKESDDALANLDNVISELAEALSESEKREQMLLDRLEGSAVERKSSN